MYSDIWICTTLLPILSTHQDSNILKLVMADSLLWEMDECNYLLSAYYVK